MANELKIKSNGLRNELKEIRKSIDKLTNAILMAKTNKYQVTNGYSNSLGGRYTITTDAQTHKHNEEPTYTWILGLAAMTALAQPTNNKNFVKEKQNIKLEYNCRATYDEIREQLQEGEITIEQAQKLWLEHREQEKFKDTKVGQFLLEKIPNIVGAIADDTPVGGVVRAIIGGSEMSDSDKELALKS